MAELSHLWFKRKLRTVSLTRMDKICSIMRINIGTVQLSLALVCHTLSAVVNIPSVVECRGKRKNSDRLCQENLECWLEPDLEEADGWLPVDDFPAYLQQEGHPDLVERLRGPFLGLD
jgi:hypothetical protein